ncbi:hypothetical protein M8818_003303 [Zalaria obscura]|uniref:Uncharacterized protein n=1 Tax=Zalaria obscura TaxID=2024903 RepID=A0ACC3SFQ7_9PEZI
MTVLHLQLALVEQKKAYGTQLPCPQSGTTTDTITSLPGELTDEGRETTRALGQRLRRLYVDQLNFIPANLSSTEPFYLRATPIPRALESVQQVFYGLYPPTTRSPTLPPPQIVTRSPNDETLYPNEGACRRFAQLSHAFAQRTADRWNESDEMAYLNNLISKWMPEDSPKVKVDSHPRLSGIMDTVNSTLAHGPLTRLPKEFYDDKGREIIDKIGVEEWYSGYGESREYRMLGIGGLLGDVVGRMVDHVRLQNGIKTVPGTEDVQFALSGCHDTTLASVLASLGAFDGEKWPPYTSHIAIELFKRQIPSASAPGAVEPATTGSSSWWTKIFGSPAEVIKGPSSSRTPLTQMSASEKGGLDGYFVRLRYNDRVMTVPACRPEGKHYEDDESICTLETFKGVVDKFTPQNWKRACNSNIGESAFPESPEPAGA